MGPGPGVCPVNCPRSSQQWPSLHSGWGAVLSMEWGALLLRDCWLAESPETWVPTLQGGVWVQRPAPQPFQQRGPRVLHGNGILGKFEKHQLRGQAWRLWLGQAWQAADPHPLSVRPSLHHSEPLLPLGQPSARVSPHEVLNQRCTSKPPTKCPIHPPPQPGELEQGRSGPPASLLCLERHWEDHSW